MNRRYSQHLNRVEENIQRRRAYQAPSDTTTESPPCALLAGAKNSEFIPMMAALHAPKVLTENLQSSPDENQQNPTS